MRVGRACDELGGVMTAVEHERLERRKVPVVSPEQGVAAARRQVTRLACDIHDGPMQELLAAGWCLESIRRAVARGGEPDSSLEDELDQLGLRLREIEEMLRTLVGSLDDSAVSRDEAAIVEAQVLAFRERCPESRVDLTVIGDITLETDSQRIALDRLLGEALTNVAKHAAAQNVAVWIHGFASCLVVQIRDDGSGFEPEVAAAGDRMGLRGMRERLELIGGRLSVTSCPGGPTMISARIEKWRPPTGEAA